MGDWTGLLSSYRHKCRCLLPSWRFLIVVNTSTRVQIEVHRSSWTFFVFPLLLGSAAPSWGVTKLSQSAEPWISSGSAGQWSRFKGNTAGEAREAELIPKRSSPRSRSDGIAGVPSLGALTVTWAQRQLLPQIRVPPQGHIVPQHCSCIKATSLHSNLKYGIRSKERKVAIHRRLYLTVTTEIQRCRVYLALCVGTMRHQTLTIHTTNTKL